MAQAGFTPIQLYRTTTASAQPSAGNLADGELAINLTDKKLYAKDASNNVFLLADASSGGTTAANLAGGAAGSLPYQTGANATTFLGIGTAAQVLQVNSGATAPEWVNTSGTGDVARTTSPSFTTPSLGAATALSINSLTLTTSTGTFTLANGKTLTVNNSLTLNGTDATVMTFPSTSATIARTDAAQTFTGTQTVQAAATQDAVALAGRAGGTSSYVSTLTPTTLSASRTVTLPDADTTVPVATQVLTFTGPTAGRTITLPDANFTVARSDAAQSFTGTQTFLSNPVLDAGTANGVLYLNGSKVVTSGSALTFNGSTLATTGALTVDGNVTLGNASTDTVTVNGYMGVGGAATPSMAVYARSTALTGSGQGGFYADIVGSSAATAEISGFRSSVRTEAAAFTVADLSHFRAFNAVKGAGSTITNQHGLYIADQTQGTNNYGITSLVSSGTNKWNIYASGTAANYFAGNVGIGTSSPAGRLEVSSSAFDTVYLTRSSVASASLIVRDSADSGFLLQNKAGGGLNLLTRVSGANTERFALTTTEAVFNDPGNDYDFRVESDTNAHALFVQGSDGKVGIGTSSPIYDFQIGAYGVDADSTLALASTTTGTCSIRFGDGTSGADANAGRIQYDHSVNAMTFATLAGTERLRIKSTGQTRFVPLAADPAGAEAGDVYYNSGTNKLRLYDGTSWVDLN